MYTCSIFVKCFYNIHISIKFNHSNLEKHIKIIKKSYLEHNFNQILNNQLMSFETLLSKIILVEGIKDVEEIKSIYSSTVKVISFDYEAHKLLNELNIKHELVEDYFSPQDEYDIDTKALELTTQWYKHKSIIELNYQGLNLGSLLEIELIGYFFEQLKRVLGIIRVIEKEKPDIIVAYFLGEIAETMCRQKKIKIQKYESKKSVELFFDSIDIPIKVGGRIFSIKISQKKFQIITKMLNQTICSLFGFKPDYNNLRIKKTILLSEYNLSTYDDLIEELSNSKNNIYLLNQRRPAIWNYHSFQIMRKSKCKIIDLDDFINKDIKIEIKKEQKKFEDNIKTLWNDNNIFVEMFSINDYSFWNGIKNNFTQLVTKRFVEAIKKIFLLNELFKNIDISCILEWAHVGLEDKLIISIANKRKIPNLFLQHGLYLQNEKLKKYVPILPILPYNSSKHLVWGNIMERFVLEYGIRQDMVIKIGSPRHDKFFRKEHIKKLDTVLLAANGFFHVNFKGTDTRSFIKMENFKTKLTRINTFIFDIDGVLTNGTITIMPDGEQIRSMNVKDGFALQLAVKRGYKIAVISGGKSEVVRLRLNGLGIYDVFLGAENKIEVFNNYISSNKINANEILYMGDDVPDYEVMKIVGVAVCPNDAAQEIKEISIYVSDKKGGEGCVRDAIEQVMRVQGKW